MNLIAIIVALVCEHLLSHLRRWRNNDWFSRYLGRLQGMILVGKLWTSAWGLVFLIPPLLVIGLLQWWLQRGMLGLVGFGFAILVLIFALGPRDLWEEVRDFLAARKDQRFERAQAIAANLTAIPGAVGEEDRGDRELIHGVLLQAHERVFAVLFWFFVLGPLGAAGYRLIAELPRQLVLQQAGNDFTRAARRLHAIAAWLPQCLTAVVYGLAGSADGAVQGWGRAEAVHYHWVARGWHLLTETGCGALRMEQGDDHRPVVLDLDDELRQALGLAWRSLIIFLAAFAVLTIGGWVA